MMKTGRLATGIAALTALTAIGSSQITSTPAGYSFKMKQVKGQKLNYSTTIKISGSQLPQSMTMSMNIKSEVVDVKNGVSTVKVSTTEMMMNGKKSGVGGQTSTVKMDSSGKIVEGQTGQAGMQSTFPTKPIKLGQTWTADQTITTAMGEQKVKAKYTLSKIEGSGARQMAIITISLQSAGAVSMQGTGLQKVLMSDCSMFSTSFTMKMTNPQMQGPMDMSMSMTRK